MHGHSDGPGNLNAHLHTWFEFVNDFFWDADIEL